MTVATPDCGSAEVEPSATVARRFAPGSVMVAVGALVSIWIVVDAGVAALPTASIAAMRTVAVVTTLKAPV